MLIKQQLASIMPHLLSVWHHDAATNTWLQFNPALWELIPKHRLLTELVDGRTYWINVSQACILFYFDGQGLYYYEFPAGWTENLVWQKAVEITSVSAQPLRVVRGEQLQVTTWVKTRRAFTGYLSICIMEPPLYTGYRSGTSTSVASWPIGSYSIANRVRIDPQNAPGNNRIRVSILEQMVDTMSVIAQDRSQVVEVCEVGIPPVPPDEPPVLPPEQPPAPPADVMAPIVGIIGMAMMMAVISEIIAVEI